MSEGPTLEEINAKIRNIKPHLIYQFTDEKRIHLYLIKRFYEDIITENIDEYYRALTAFTDIPLYFNFKTTPLFSGDMNRHYISHCRASFETDLEPDETPYFRTVKENMADIWSDCLAGHFGRKAAEDSNAFRVEEGIHKIVWQLDKTPKSLISILKKIYNIDPTPAYAVEIVKLLFEGYKKMYKSKIRQSLFDRECVEYPRINDTTKLYYISISL
jgi:hypothetical protein